jgi:endonuclease/exonuclease/phosphatase (EEP) superfamily protein YafD
MSADRLQQATGLNHWEEEFKLGRGQDKLFGLAVLSRYPILAKSAIRFDNDKNNSGMYVDLLVGGDTVRVYNMHLSSIGFEKADYEDARNVQDEAARSRLYSRLAAAWQKRTDQAEQVAASVAKSPHPVIAVGDFNDTPVSYAAHRFSAHLRDAYRSAGAFQGPLLGASYIGDLPFLRIDQVWASPELDVVDYQTGRVELSDHRPVQVVFQWGE